MRLIILYGKFVPAKKGKTQQLINGNLTCGYRDYAKYAGKIIYMSPQVTSSSYDMSITNPASIIKLCNDNPNAIVWVIKRFIPKDKRHKVLKNIPNFKVYYSCNSKNTMWGACDISLVDTPERVTHASHRLFIKGKDPNFWKPTKEKKYDYVVVGRLNNKNQMYFIDKMSKIKKRRSILWIGGKGVKNKIDSKHNVVYTKLRGPDFVRDSISKARVGVLYSEIKSEGFPQAFLEMTMCGVPVVYGGPYNPGYFFPENSLVLKNKRNIAFAAEELLANHDSEACRNIAIENYSLEKSISLLESYRGDTKLEDSSDQAANSEL